jgi:hypothetical protein
MHMGSPIRALWGTVVLLCGVLALIGALVLLVPMREKGAEVEDFRTKGRIALAVVNDSGIDQVTSRVSTRRNAATTTTNEYKLYVTYDEQSPVSYADFGRAVRIEQLTVPTVDPAKITGIVEVPQATYDSAKQGDQIVVAFLPDEPDLPRRYEDIRDFSARPYQVGMGVLGLLGFALLYLGRRMRRWIAVSE